MPYLVLIAAYLLGCFLAMGIISYVNRKEFEEGASVFLSPTDAWWSWAFVLKAAWIFLVEFIKSWGDNGTKH